MSDEIVHQGDMMKSDENLKADLLIAYAETLADFQCRMTPAQADDYLHIHHGTVRGAIERKEIRHYKIGKRLRVTPAQIAEWLKSYEIKPDPLPS